MKNLDLLILKLKIYNRLGRYIPFFNKNKAVLKFLDKHFSDVKNNFCNYNPVINQQNKKIIWQLWWQGIENAPPLVKKCMNSVKNNCNNAQVIVITQENLNQYIELPDYIIQKFSEGKITNTHFSDIIRMELLSKYGGLWIDATVFVSQPIPEMCFSSPYYTIHYTTSNSSIAKGRWCGFCQASLEGQVIQTFIREMFHSYWSKFDRLIDYFLIDYIMLYGYENIPSFKAAVDSVPVNNEGIKQLDLNFNNEYIESKYKELLNSSVFFKLNWKRNYINKTSDNKITNFGHFIEQNDYENIK